MCTSHQPSHGKLSRIQAEVLMMLEYGSALFWSVLEREGLLLPSEETCRPFSRPGKRKTGFAGAPASTLDLQLQPHQQDEV